MTDPTEAQISQRIKRGPAKGQVHPVAGPPSLDEQVAQVDRTKRLLMLGFGGVAMPPALRDLPRDADGVQIPWFMHIDADGTPDRVRVRAHGVRDALRDERCWTCGSRRGRWGSFVLNPLMFVDGRSLEPPSHTSCAMWLATAFPFVAQPIAMMRSAEFRGVSVVATTREWRVRPVFGDIDLGAVDQVQWFVGGAMTNEATAYAEVEAELERFRSAPVPPMPGDPDDLLTRAAAALGEASDA